MAESNCYRVKDLQKILGISRVTVYKLLQRHEFHWMQIGGVYIIPKKGFDEWMQGGVDPKLFSLED